MVVLVKIKKVVWAIGNLYLHPELHDSTNLRTMYEIQSYVRSYKYPYFIGGDWNLEPHDLMRRQWDLVQHGMIITPRNTSFTCTASICGTMYDYAVTSYHMNHFISGCVAKTEKCILYAFCREV